jgi:hypothetical protein
VTPHGISTRTLHRFADYEATRHASAATVARIVRGDLDVSIADGLVPVTEMVDSRTGEPLKPPPEAANVSSLADKQQCRAIRRRQAKAARKAAKRAA